MNSFINKKIRAYDEPTRKGTPKGEAVGFSGKKYAATLFTLTNLPIGKAAQKLDTSYALLKKWRTEPKFKAEVEKHRNELATIIIEHIRARTRGWWMPYEDDPVDIANSSEYFEKLNMLRNMPVLKEMLDMDTYDKRTILAILKKAKRGDDDIIGFILRNMLCVVFFDKGLVLPEQFQRDFNLRRQTLRPLFRELVPELLEDLADILEKKRMADVDRVVAFSIVDAVRVIFLIYK